jgi:hypothetical protein
MIGAVVAVSILSAGQHCGYGGYATTYQNYAYQGYYPTYSYGYNYVQPTYYHAPYVQKQVITKFVEVVPSSTYSALGSEYVRAEKKAEEVQGLREQLAELKGIVTTLSQVQAQPAPAPTIVQQQPAPPPAPVYAQAQSPQPQLQPIYPQPQTPSKGFQSIAPAPPIYPAKSPPSTQAPPPPLDPAGFSGASAGPTAVVSGTSLQRCAGCHTGSNPSGFVIFDAPGRLRADLGADDWALMEDQITTGQMPKGQPFSLAELASFMKEKSAALAGVSSPVAAVSPRNPF